MGVNLEIGLLAALLTFVVGLPWLFVLAVFFVTTGAVFVLRRKPSGIKKTGYHVVDPLGARGVGLLVTVQRLLVEHFPTLRLLVIHIMGVGKHLDTADLEEVPTFLPRHFPTKEEAILPPLSFDALQAVVSAAQEALLAPNDGFKYNRVLDYSRAYRNGSATPTDVAIRLTAAIKHSNAVHKLHAIIDYDEDLIMAQAEESTARLAAGEPRSILEGIPVSAKDQIHVTGLLTSKGCQVEDGTPVAQQDATAVEKLRALGAIIFGKANQTEMGIHVTGLNANTRYGHCRNPYNLFHHTGGSSSGSGSAVGAGLGPISVAADGGGSIRIPSGLCGQVGLKPTFGRVSLLGDVACFGSSVDVVGPIGASAFDAAIGIAAMAGTDQGDNATLHAPSFHLGRLGLGDPTTQRQAEVRIGVYSSWFEDSVPEMQEPCRAALARLEALGAQIVEIEIPELELMIDAHTTTISTEMFADVQSRMRTNPGWFGDNTRLLFASCGMPTSLNYLQASKARTRIMNHISKAFESVDFIATPNTSTLPPPLPLDLAEGKDELDPKKQCLIMRFMHCANFTGVPAVTFPVGYAAGNLPVAMQLIGRPWAEGDLLHMAALAGSFVPRNRPEVYYDLLHGDAADWRV